VSKVTRLFSCMGFEITLVTDVVVTG